MSTATLKSASQPENDPESLTPAFLKLQQGEKSGTLRLQGPDSRVKYVYFRKGVVELVKTSKSRTLLGRALVKRRMLTEQQLQSALDRQAAGNHELRLGQILIGMGILPADDIQKALAWVTAEEILELFTWSNVRWDFIRGDPPLDVFDSEDLQARVALKPERLVQEAEKRSVELQAIRRALPSFADVYVPVGDAAERYLGRTDGGDAARDVVSCLDGARDVQDVLDDCHTVDLVALRALSKMVQSGDIAPIAPAQLMALGQELEDRRDFNRARRRYLRAEELGHPDFDLPRRIGQIDEITGDLASACRRYVAYAERCEQAGYPDVTAATLRRVLELAAPPGVAPSVKALARETRVKLASALETAGKTDEASAEYIKLLADLPADAPLDERIRAVSAILALSPEKTELREELAELYLKQGDNAQAIMELQDVAAGALAEGYHGKAVSVLEKILTIDPHEILTHQQLASTLATAGQNERAVAEYLKITKHLEEMGLASASAQTLVQIYEKVVELDPLNAQARQWLAQAYEGKAEADKAIKHVSGMVDALRKAARKEELSVALDKLCTYKPDDRALALERARLKKELGKSEDARTAFRAVAEAAVKAKELETATEALKEVLDATPGDLESQLSLARVESQTQKTSQAAKRCGAVFELAFISGKLDLADEAVKKAIDIEPDAPLHRERTARLLEARSQPQEAAKSLVKAARLARSEDDHGFARAWTKRALELDPTSEDARDVLEQLKRVGLPTATPASGGQAAPAAPAPVAPAPVAPERYEPSKGSQRISGITITGGGQGSVQIQGVTTRRLTGIADKLKELKGGGTGEGGAPDASGPRSDLYQAPADANEEVVKQKAKSAMDRLRALKGGAPPKQASSETPGGTTGAPGSSDATAPIPTQTPNASPASSAAATAGAAAPAGTPGSKNEVADATIAKKASSAMDKLRALKGGGPSPAKAEGGAAAPDIAKPSADLPAGTPGSANTAIAPELAKKASSAMDRLRALKGGAPPPARPVEATPPPPSEAPPPPPPEAPAAKSPTSDDAFQALAADAPSPAASAPPPPPPPFDSAQGERGRTPPPPPPAASTPAPTSEPPKTRSLPRLPKTGLGAAANAAELPPGTPGSKNEVAAPELAKKASSAMDRLKAMKSGAPPKPRSESATPSSGEVPAAGAPDPNAAQPAAGAAAPPGTPGSKNEVVAPELAKKASSAMDRLKAMKSGAPPPPKASTSATPSSGATPAIAGGDPAAAAAPAAGGPPAGTPGSKNEVAAPELAKKASSAMERLKALKGGGAPKAGDAAAGGLPAGMPEKISKGPEAPGEAADPALSKKASSARDRLKAMRGGGMSAAGAGGSSPAAGAGQEPNETPGAGGTATAEDPGTEATT